MKHEVEVYHKENEDISPILEVIKATYQDKRILEALNSLPHTGVSEDGRRYVLFLGERAAIVLKRVKRDKVKVVIITGSPSEIGAALKAENIMAPFGLASPVEKSMRKCLRMALAGEIPEASDKKDEKDSPDMRDEEDRRDSQDKKDKRDDEEYTADDEVYVDERLKEALLGKKK